MHQVDSDECPVIKSFLPTSADAVLSAEDARRGRVFRLSRKTVGDTRWRATSRLVEAGGCRWVLVAAINESTAEVKYVVTPEGLKIEVAGVRFLVSAEAKQIAQGWGAKVTIKAEATDGKEHVLLNPKSGPIAFAAAVFKKGSTEAERIPDSREGDGELKIGGSATSFSREFPSKGGRVLGMGETLDMEVALWGLGETAADRRPVKQFFHVKMKVDKGKPKAIVEPPASVSQ